MSQKILDNRPPKIALHLIAGNQNTQKFIQQSLDHLQEFCKTTPYFNILAKRKKVSSNNLVK
jgi:hypothetical protein